MQISGGPNLQATVTAGCKALAALLKAAPRDQLAECSKAAREYVTTFLRLFSAVQLVRSSPSAAPLVDRFWQQVMECPLALTAAADALRACHGCDATKNVRDLNLIGTAVYEHMDFLGPCNADGRQFSGLYEMFGSESLQQFAVEVLAVETASSRPSLPPEEAQQLEISRRVLVVAAEGGKISEARLSSLLAHEGILAPLQALAEGRADFSDSNDGSARFVEAAYRHIAARHRSSSGSQLAGPETHREAQRAVAGALRQGIVLLQLRAVVPSQRQRAVRRALREGFLRVRTVGLISQRDV